MIPRLKPPLGLHELLAAWSLLPRHSVARFEAAFAERMGQQHAVAFPYGRTGLVALLKALGLYGKEIICPAYTCVVVPHAIVTSGNTPVFVDSESGGFNMDLGAAQAAVTDNTAAVIATSIFGYPVDLDALAAFQAAHPQVTVIQDCAHSFDAAWQGRPVQREGMAAIFGLNVSKLLCSIFGGMVSLDDKKLHEKLLQEREAMLSGPGLGKGLRRLAYVNAAWPAFWGPVYGLVNRLERSGRLNRHVQYYDEARIDMPADYLVAMTQVEARVGLANLKRYPRTLRLRQEAAAHYFDHLESRPECVLPPQVQGATYSHFTVLVDEREVLLEAALDRGVQLGQLIEYNIPEMSAYGSGPADVFPRSAGYSRRSVNLPVWGGEQVAAKVLKRLEDLLPVR